jgi:outer membrane protein with beta-barrel domain
LRNLLLAVTLACAAGAAHADAGMVYVGGGITSNNVDASSVPVSEFLNQYPDISGTGWQAYAGVRPVKAFAAELEYFDAGSDTSSYFSPLCCVGSGACGSTWHTDAKAIAGYAVGFLPLPVPALDVFAKLGMARYTLDRNGNSTYHDPFTGSSTITYYNDSGTSNVFAWSAGFQVHVGRFGGRFEYVGLEKANTRVLALSAFVAFL